MENYLFLIWFIGMVVAIAVRLHHFFKWVEQGIPPPINNTMVEWMIIVFWPLGVPTFLLWRYNKKI